MEKHDSFNLSVIKPLPPYCITGGIVEIDGDHPKHTDRFSRISLLAANFGDSHQNRGN